MVKKALSNLRPYLISGGKIVLVVFLVVVAIIYLTHSLLAVTFPYPMDYGEAPLVNQAMNLRAGENIYRPDIADPPYTIANYTPLYVLSLTPFVGQLDTVFNTGRAISVLSAVATAVFLGLIIYTFTQDRLASVATSIIYLAIPYVVSWSGLLRIDSMAMAFSTAGLLVLVRWPDSRRGFLIGGLLLVAAIYTRQSYALAAPLAAFAWLWSRHGWRRALALALYVGGVSLALFILLNLITDGGFYYNIITANVNEFGWERLTRHLEDLRDTVPILLALAVLLLIFGYKRISYWPLLAFYLIGAFLSALTIGKIGSNVNYFLELSAALGLVAGAYLAWSRSIGWAYVFVILLVVAQTGWLMNRTMDTMVDGRLTGRLGDEQAIHRLAGVVNDSVGDVLADEYMGLLTMERRPLYIQPFEVSQLVGAGKWDQGPLLDDLADQTFPLVLIHHFGPYPVHEERWTPEMLDAIRQYYRPVMTVAGTVIYRPQEKTDITAVPDPIPAAAFIPDAINLGINQRISQTEYAGQPHIAVNPSNPEHLAAVVTTVSDFECNPPDCDVTLTLYTSLDGGETWREQAPFSQGRGLIMSGMVGFDSEDTLFVTGIRDGALTINSATAVEDYDMARTQQGEITRALVAAKPWFRIDENDNLYVSYDGQYQDNLIVSPSFNRSDDGGQNWSFTVKVDQGVEVADIQQDRANGPDDIQVLPGQGDELALVWVWETDPASWPQDIWLATSTVGGETLSPPTRIGETWGPISTAVRDGIYYILYRTGTEDEQQLVLAVTDDNGRTWRSTLINGDIPLTFSTDKAPGINVAPDGTIDIIFYARHSSPETADCGLDLETWKWYGRFNWIDTCLYDVYYTYSQDGGSSFSQPHKLNEVPIRAENFVQAFGRTEIASHFSIASTDEAGYPIWIDTIGNDGTQAYTVRIER